MNAGGDGGAIAATINAIDIPSKSTDGHSKINRSDTLMRFWLWPTHPNLNQQHEDAIKSALTTRPQLAEYKGFAIDHIRFIRHEMKGDQIYHLQVSVWDHDETLDILNWEVQTGRLDNHIAALYWIPL